MGLAFLAASPVALAASPAATLGKAYHAYLEGDLASARTLAVAAEKKVRARDYALYLAAQSAALAGDCGDALPRYRALTGMADSRFRQIAAWRAADCLWELERVAEARAAYERLVPSTMPVRPQTGDISTRPLDGDPAVGLARIARAHEREGAPARARAAWRRLAVELPAHPLAAEAIAALERSSAPLGARERIERAERLTAGREWPLALEELARVGDDEPDDVRTLRDYWIGTTLFKMRRQYERAGRLLIAVHTRMGGRAAEALFHGARALSRADLDDEAIVRYGEVVKKYPGTSWAAEAQYLSGWLELNRGRWREALPALQATVTRYGSSKWAADATWHLGFSHYLLGEHDEALKHLARVAARSGALDGGKGRYWRARSLAALGRDEESVTELRRIVTTWPLTWYALLARARLAEKDIQIGVFGDRAERADPPAPPGKADPRAAGDRLIQVVDELLSASMPREAALELRRGERAFLGRYSKGGGAMPVLLQRYAKAGNHNRPWQLAAGHRALGGPPRGNARIWWERAFPRAFRTHVEKHEPLGKNPPYYLYAIMQKESGYDPHVVSYADAIGLLQMIPATTRRVAPLLGMTYTDDLLYDPELNVKVASWYIGNLLQKFRGQIPLAAGSFNSGPRPVMRWLDQHGTRPMDELVELVAYTPTREYMKKVTAIYARYLLLYEGREYWQPLAVEPGYVKDEIDY
jgi:soluble lytic murein transglycosylase